MSSDHDDDFWVDVKTVTVSLEESPEPRLIRWRLSPFSAQEKWACTFRIRAPGPAREEKE